MPAAVTLGAGVVIGLLLNQVVVLWCKLRAANSNVSKEVIREPGVESKDAVGNRAAEEHGMPRQASSDTVSSRREGGAEELQESRRLDGALQRLERLCADLARTHQSAIDSAAGDDPVLTWDEAASLLRELNYDARKLQTQVASTPLLRTALLQVTQPATRIWVDGVFDLTHYGHFFFCLRARQLGSQLVVGVNDGESVKQAKGTTPILTDEERICMIESCKFVDIVERNVPYVMDSKYLQAMIDKHNLSVVAHGDDPCFDAHGNDVYAEVKRRKMYRTIDRVTGISTTELVGRMVTFVATHYQVQQETRSGGVLVLPFAKNLQKCPSDSNLLRGHSQSFAPDGGDDDDDDQPAAVRSTSVPAGSSLGAKLHESDSNVDLSEEEPKVDTPTGALQQDVHAEEQHENAWSFAASGTIFNEFLRACIRPPQNLQALCYMDGTWDLLNAGHIQTLQESRRQAQEHLGRDVYLILGVHSDVEAHRRYHDWPILNMQERVLAIMAIRGVDNVIIDAPWRVTDSFMAQLGIELVLYAAEPGWDTDKALRQDRYSHPRAAGKYIEVTRPPGGLSVEKVMDRIYRQRDSYETQLEKKKRKESAFYDQKFRRNSRERSSLFSSASPISRSVESESPEDGEIRRTWSTGDWSRGLARTTSLPTHSAPL